MIIIYLGTESFFVISQFSLFSWCPQEYDERGNISLYVNLALFGLLSKNHEYFLYKKTTTTSFFRLCIKIRKCNNLFLYISLTFRLRILKRDAKRTSCKGVIMKLSGFFRKKNYKFLRILWIFAHFSEFFTAQTPFSENINI